MKENIIKNKSFAFSLQIIGLYKLLIQQNEYVISKQLLRSATSIGANIFESEAAQSKPDFISKLSIASKESRETEYWLLLLQESQLIKIDVTDYINHVVEIKKILSSIIKSTKENLISTAN